MKSIFTFIIAAFLLFPLQAQEKVYTVDNLPKVHLQNKMQYVCNPAGILSQAACDSIDAMLYALEQQTGIETVVAVVPSIGETDCFDFCHQLLNGTPFALALMLKVGEQNVIAQITVVQIPDHKHTNGVIRISVNDHCRLVGRFRGGNIICMKLDTVRIDNKSIFECVRLAQTIHPWAEEWIVSVHIGIRVSIFRQNLGIRSQ